ncbi:MAG TPA: tetratricopeptide repeat protein, partial [Caldithrix sp.]|nr:tetratricopeptide repeat protein [Caldithrix sp.]
YKIQGKIEEARSAYEKSLAIKSDFYPAIQNLALSYGSEQKWQDVINVIEDGRYQVDSTKVFPVILVAQAYYSLKDYDKARAKILPVIDNGEAPIELYELIARVEFEAKNYEAAKKYWQYILNKDENNKMASLYLGALFLETEKPDSAVIVYKKAYDAHPADPTILGFYGSALQQLAQFEQALPYLKKSYKLNPDNINVISSLAVVYENLNQFEKSDSLYEAAIQQFPDDALLLNNYSYSLSERGIRLDEALTMVKKALQISPDNGAYLDTIGWIYYKLKNYLEAEKYIKQAIEVRENSSVVFEHLGDVYYELKQYNLARENWRKALDLQPDNESLKLKLEKVK